MKTLLTTTLTALLAISILAPAQAAWYAKFDGVDGSCAQAQEAMDDLKAPETEEAIALLLPAVQKVREAANRTQSSCEDPTGGEGDVACAAQTLSALILDSTTGRDGVPGLLNLAAKGTGEPLKSAKLFVRKQGTEAAPGTEKMIIAVLIGLLRETQAQGIKDPTVLDPIVGAVRIADEIDPDVATASYPRTGYDLKLAKKV